VNRSSISFRHAHVLRVGIVAALLWAIPPAGDRLIDSGGEALSITQLPESLPFLVDSIDPQATPDGFWTLKNDRGEALGYAARTLPQAADVLGYRGPSEAVIVIDTDKRIVGTRLLRSADTQEHVEAVVTDRTFLNQFLGWNWGDVTVGRSVDGVSGATLTSMAVAEGIVRRMGGGDVSLLFAEPVAATEIRDWFPAAAELRPSGSVIEVLGDDDKTIGTVWRTGILSDDVIGYQGPSEILIRLSGQDDRTAGAIKLRSSYDNEPYVDYVRDEAYFWNLFLGKSIDELAEMDLAAERVEGVSGATMTSMAVAETMVAAAIADAKTQAIAPESSVPICQQVRWSPSDVITLAVLCVLAAASRAGWFAGRTFRRCWLVTVVVVIGLYSGNLISLALIAGWSAEGMAWRLAPGLSAVAILAGLAPVIGKSNPYCNHVCPHGAMQQLIRPVGVSRRRLRLPARLNRWLTRLPAVMLVAAYLTLVIRPAVDLSSWEPFHAYLFRIAPITATAFAAGTLIFAAFVPMGYCRFGCPTGFLIDHLRRSAKSDQVRRGDWVAIGLLAVAIAVPLLSVDETPRSRRPPPTGDEDRRAGRLQTVGPTAHDAARWGLSHHESSSAATSDLVASIADKASSPTHSLRATSAAASS